MSDDDDGIRQRNWSTRISGIADMVTMTIGPGEFITLDSNTARKMGERLIIEAARAEGCTANIRIRVDEAP